jgi:hypothetical protein
LAESLSVIGEPIDGSKWSGTIWGMKSQIAPQSEPPPPVNLQELLPAKEEAQKLHEVMQIKQKLWQEALAVKEAALEAAAADFKRAMQSEASARSVKEPAAPPRGASSTTLDAINHGNGINPNLAYTVKQVAEFLQLSQDTVMGFCRTKVWKCSFQRNAYRIKGSAVLEWLDGK